MSKISEQEQEYIRSEIQDLVDYSNEEVFDIEDYINNCDHLSGEQKKWAKKHIGMYAKVEII